MSPEMSPPWVDNPQSMELLPPKTFHIKLDHAIQFLREPTKVQENLLRGGGEIDVSRDAVRREAVRRYIWECRVRANSVGETRLEYEPSDLTKLWAKPQKWLSVSEEMVRALKEWQVFDGYSNGSAKKHLETYFWHNPPFSAAVTPYRGAVELPGSRYRLSVYADELKRLKPRPENKFKGRDEITIVAWSCNGSNNNGAAKPGGVFVFELGLAALACRNRDQASPNQGHFLWSVFDKDHLFKLENFDEEVVIGAAFSLAKAMEYGHGIDYSVYPEYFEQIAERDGFNGLEELASRAQENFDLARTSLIRLGTGANWSRVRRAEKG
jgi:hypothetical protein